MPSDLTPNQPKLLDQVRTAIRLRRMSYRTEQTYTDWIKRFIVFHHKRHPREMGAPEVQAICHLPYAIYYWSLQSIRRSAADQQSNRT